MNSPLRHPSLFAPLAPFCGKVLSHLPAAYSLKPIASLTLLCTMLHAPCANAAGISSTHTLATGTVAITNTQKRSAWHPIAILFRFNDPATGTITIQRESQNIQHLLATTTHSNNQHAIWIAPAAITFNENDILIISVTATNGTLELIRKGE